MSHNVTTAFLYRPSSFAAYRLFRVYDFLESTVWVRCLFLPEKAFVFFFLLQSGRKVGSKGYRLIAASFKFPQCICFRWACLGTAFFVFSPNRYRVPNSPTSISPAVFVIFFRDWSRLLFRIGHRGLRRKSLIPTLPRALGCL